MARLEEVLAELKYDSHGLIPVIIQDSESHRVLMLGYMNQTSLLTTVRTGTTHFWSRSRQQYWMKGEKSGHTQQVHSIHIDCDRDTVLMMVTQRGGACHAGYYSCFYRRLNQQGEWEVAEERLFDPEQTYGKS